MSAVALYEARLIFRGSVSSKFYQVTVTRSRTANYPSPGKWLYEVERRWGRLPSGHKGAWRALGRKKVEIFSAQRLAIEHASKVTAGKLDKGYEWFADVWSVDYVAHVRRGREALGVQEIKAAPVDFSEAFQEFVSRGR